MESLSKDSQQAWQIRDMQLADLIAVHANELGAYEFPWSQGTFEDCLQVGYPAWVMEQDDGNLIAHAVMSMAVGEAHILNICTHPLYQRQGLGRAMLEHMLDYAFGESVIRMFLEVRASNLPALRLYEQYEFEEVGIRKAYYPAAQGREDAVVLMRNF